MSDVLDYASDAEGEWTDDDYDDYMWAQSRCLHSCHASVLHIPSCAVKLEEEAAAEATQDAQKDN